MLGGPSVVGPAVETAVDKLAPTIVRVSGADRYGTSAAVAEDLFVSSTKAFVASGANFADALAGGVAAAAVRAPLVLTPPNCIPDVVQTQLDRLGVTAITVLGGTASISAAVASGVSCGVPDWLTLVNQYRHAYGVRAVTNDAQGAGDAAAHIYYMNNTGDFTHYENLASPFSTASGDSGGQNSDLSFNGGTGTALIDGWMAAPFHAIAMLRPSADAEAFVYDDAYGALHLAYNWDTMPTPAWPLHWPSASLPDRLLTLSEGELPNPTSPCPADYQNRTVGLPLIVSFGMDAGVVASASATLSVGGQSLPACVVDESNFTYPDPAWQQDGLSILSENHSVLVIPQKPLVAGTTYDVAVHTNVGDASWSFSTVG